jgi:hypothetical protein
VLGPIKNKVIVDQAVGGGAVPILPLRSNVAAAAAATVAGAGAAR